jgi:hypothetical protein
MTVEIKKFGTILISRQLGREALAAFFSDFNELKEEIIIDFEGLNVLSPSWADEFITPLHKKFKEKLIIKKSDNSSVIETLALLEKVNNVKFNFK